MQYNDDRLKIFIDDSKGSLYDKLDNNLKTAFEKMILILLDKVLPFMPMFMRYFTDHGASHSRQVARIMDQFIVNIKPSINPDEAFILLASAWLHDIGMLNNIDPKTGEELSEDTIREMHAELSSEFIEKHKDKLFYGLDSSLKLSIQIVCKNHTTNVDVWNSPENDFEEYGYRNRLLISILRLADILDLRADRAPEILGETIKFPDTSALHWEIYKTINIKKEPIFNYFEKKTGKNRISIDIAAIAGQENEKLMTSLYCHVIKKIDEEIEKVRHFFEVAGVFLPTAITPHFRTCDGQKKNIGNPDLNADYYFKKSKLELFEAEYQKISRQYNNPFVLIDLCMEVAEKCESKEMVDFKTHAIEWRDRAKKHFEEIKGGFPITGYFYVRKYYNEIKMKEITDISGDEKLFLDDMEKINRSIYYLLNTKALNIEIILGSLILLRYGITPYRQELKQAILSISKNRIENINNEKSELSVHNQCNLCTGRALSIFSYLKQFEPCFHESDFRQVNSKIKGMFDWIQTQKEHKYSTIKNKPDAIQSPRYNASILEGLLDLNFFNKGLIETNKIINTIEDVANAWLDEITKIDKNRLEEHPSIVYGRFFRSIYLYDSQFKDHNILQKFRGEKEFWEGHLKGFRDDPISSKIDGWDLSTCWDIWDDNEMKVLSRTNSENTRYAVSESPIWRENGSWGDNDSSTRSTIEGWLFYWEHYWRLKEAEPKEGVSP
ncbi:MAG: HD domain-containing protein [Acidobacteria bacterium]|nr:HD domain-containing protein [Acidobacteriota bacterium]